MSAQQNLHFLNPLEELELKDAVDAKKKKVVLGGREFTIRYEGSEVFVRIKEGMVPCGWFDIDRIGEFGE